MEDDFRSNRHKLPPEAFAIHPEGPEPEPRDPIDKDTWNGITWLTDDVSIRTSDDYGTELKAMHELWASMIDLTFPVGSPWSEALMDVADNLQGALFNAMSGFYKVAIGCLRIALENMVVGAHLQFEGTPVKISDWREGKTEVKFGRLCDQLSKSKVVVPLEKHLRDTTGHSLFGQKSETQPPGWVRFFYGELSDFLHAKPTSSDNALWDGSNGPIFVASSFFSVHSFYLNSVFLAYTLNKLARPDFVPPASGKWFFHSRRIKTGTLIRNCYTYLFGEIP